MVVLVNKKNFMSILSYVPKVAKVDDVRVVLDVVPPLWNRIDRDPSCAKVVLSEALVPMVQMPVTELEADSNVSEFSTTGCPKPEKVSRMIPSWTKSCVRNRCFMLLAVPGLGTETVGEINFPVRVHEK